MTSPARLLSALPFRLSLLYAALFAAVTIAIMAAAGLVAAEVFEQRTRASVEAAVADLRLAFGRGGPPGLTATMARARIDWDEIPLDLHVAPAPRALRAFTPDIEDRGGGWLVYVPPGADFDERRLGRIEALGPKTWLLVGASLEPVHDARELMWAGIGWTLGISLPLAVLYGLMLSRTVFRRIDAVSAAARRVRDSDLSARVPVRGAGDEFDRLAINLNAMLDSIQTLTQGLQAVTVGVAHDLRTPLTRIRNKLDRLPGDDAVVAELVTEVQDVIATFDALLRLADIDSGVRRAGFERVQLSAVVAELAETYEPVAAAGGRRLESKIAPGIDVQADAALITQMLANLLDNALEHTPPGALVQLTLDAAGGVPRLTVADDGPGVPEADREAVFARFHRLDPSRSTRGAGLGLSLVRAVAKLHGVDVALADNRPGLRVELAFTSPSTPARP